LIYKRKDRREKLHKPIVRMQPMIQRWHGYPTGVTGAWTAARSQQAGSDATTARWRTPGSHDDHIVVTSASSSSCLDSYRHGATLQNCLSPADRVNVTVVTFLWHQQLLFNYVRDVYCV